MVERTVVSELDLIAQAKLDLSVHYQQFPLVLNDCRSVDFHFNKKHLVYNFLPMWVVKAKGQTYYVSNVTANCPWATKETPNSPATKGTIRFKNCSIGISADGMAIISQSN